MIAPAADTLPFAPTLLPPDGGARAGASPQDAFAAFLKDEQALPTTTPLESEKGTAVAGHVMWVFSSLIDAPPETLQDEETSQAQTGEEKEALALQSIMQSLQDLLHPLQARVILPAQASDVPTPGGGGQPSGAGAFAGDTIPALVEGALGAVAAYRPESMLGDIAAAPVAVEAANPGALAELLPDETANGAHRLAATSDFSSQLQEALATEGPEGTAQWQDIDSQDGRPSTTSQEEGHGPQDNAPTTQMPAHFSGGAGEGRSVASPLATAEERARPLAQPTAPGVSEPAAQTPERLLPRHTLLLQLHPPELGTMQIRVRLANEQLSASFWADSPEVRSLLQTQFPSLQQHLSAQGFQVQHISMSSAAGDFAGYPGQSTQQHAESQSQTHSQRPPETAEGGREAVTTNVGRRALSRRGFVDVII
jgi:hypothetical protein